LSLLWIFTLIPRATYIALPQGTKPPRIRGHKIRAFYFTKLQLELGVETHEIEGFKIMVFSPEKTVADSFKYANKVGLNIAIEALKMCISQRHSRARDFLQFACAARVTKKMQPYLEAIYE
jgi:predicted transcriptional regulator of viral defense system